MKSLKGNIAFITGASSGIGEATAKLFAHEGANLILVARRNNILQKLSKKIKNEFNVEVKTIQLDIQNYKSVLTAYNKLPAEWKAIDILVNNAGLSRGLKNIQDSEIQDWEEMINTNIKGLLYVTRLILPGMVKRNSGHVVNLGSIAGHFTYPGGNVYSATKFFVNSLSQGMRMDLLGTNVRVTSVDPGLVETEFSLVRYRGDKDKAKKPYEGLTPLKGEDVADAILYAVTRPAHVNIQELIVMPTDQASLWHISRNKK